jgi:hypothetical protein
VPVRSVLLPHRWVTFREPEGRIITKYCCETGLG